MGELLWQSMSEIEFTIKADVVDLRETQILMSGAEGAGVFLANAVLRVAIGSGVAGGEGVDRQISHTVEKSQAK
jgi:hypothetical protein